MESVSPQFKWRLDPPSFKIRGRQVSRFHLAQKSGNFSFRWQSSQKYICKFYYNIDFLKDIEREYRILRELKHQNVIRYEDFELDGANGVAKLYTELCPKFDLELYLQDSSHLNHELPYLLARQVVQQISSALVYLHFGIVISVNHDGSLDSPDLADNPEAFGGLDAFKPIIHRDIKPKNSNKRSSLCIKCFAYHGSICP